MKLAVRRVLKDDPDSGLKAGEMVLVDLDYGWDPEKVILLTRLAPNSDICRSQYKSALARVRPRELRDYLEGK